jgi:cell volume regulation protein A
MRYRYAGRIQPGDQVYLFAPPRHLRLLDRLFASPASLDEHDADFYGVFTVDPGKTLQELQKTYDIPANGLDLDATIAEFIEQRLGGRGDIGDRVGIGDLELVVRNVNDRGEIKSVGLSFEPRPPISSWLPIFLKASALLARLARPAKGNSDS